MQELFFVFEDVVIDRAARCVKAAVNDWVTHAWYGAYHWGLPMKPEMKRRLLDGLYVIRYEPQHEIGRVVFIQDQVNYWPEDTKRLHHTVVGGGREALFVVFQTEERLFGVCLKQTHTHQL